MVTAEGETRGKFTEMVMDVKYDAWVIEGLSHGILPIIDSKENTGQFSIPVEIIEKNKEEVTITGITADPKELSIKVGEQAKPNITVTGTGAYDHDYVAMSSDATKVRVTTDGRITGVDVGSATITYRSAGDPSKTVTVQVTVTAQGA